MPAPLDEQIPTAVVDAPSSAGAEIRRRAIVGIFSLTLRGAGIRLFGLIGYLVSARFLSPAEYGIAGFGLTITFAAHFLSDAGLGAGLVRAPQEPSRKTYAAVQAAQLAVIMVALAGCLIWALLSRSTTSIVTALFVSSLPLASLRMPGMIHLERRLDFSPSIRADLTEVLVYNLWIVVGLSLDWGVYALATGAVVKTAVGTIVLNRSTPLGWVRPRVDIPAVRSLLRFGATFQASGAVTLGKEQALNTITILISGYTVLGYWAIAARVVGVPLLLFESLVRISFPAAARLLALGEDLKTLLETQTRRSTMLFGLVLAPSAVAATVLVPAVLGSSWDKATTVLPVIFLGVMFSQPISAIASGYLLAAGDARIVLRAAVSIALVQLPVTAALLPSLGYMALGIGQCAGSIADGLVLAGSVKRRNGASLLPLLIPSAVNYAVAVTTGLVIARSGGLAAEIAAVPVTVVLFAAVAFALDRDAVRDLIGMLRTVPGRLRAPAVAEA